MAWLVGAWRGAGVLEYEGIEATGYVHELHIDNDAAGPYLRLRSDIWLTTEPPEQVDNEVAGGRMYAALTKGQLWSSTTGYLRTSPGKKPSDGQYPLEGMTASGAGHAITWAGVIRGPQLRFVTDLIATTPTATGIDGEQVIAGLVDSDLFYRVDMAAFGQEMRSYFAGRLSRIETSSE